MMQYKPYNYYKCGFIKILNNLIAGLKTIGQKVKIRIFLNVKIVFKVLSNILIRTLMSVFILTYFEVY
jgi:hypothetical protein